MKSLLLLLPLLTIASAHAVGPKVQCAPAPENYVAPFDPATFMAKEKISSITPGMSEQHLQNFFYEYLKFPVSLRKEMIDAGATIRLMEGKGVTIDPTWDKKHDKNLVGRDWSEVPGSGGFGWANVPTRIVVNNIYTHFGNHGHGSVSLVLHEHGHTLDTIYPRKRLAEGKKWRALLDGSPRVMELLDILCLDKYCINNIEEGFAELFAYYYACDESRAHMEAVVPEIAAFFRDFKSAKQLKNKRFNFASLFE